MENISVSWTVSVQIVLQALSRTASRAEQPGAQEPWAELFFTGMTLRVGAGRSLQLGRCPGHPTAPGCAEKDGHTGSMWARQAQSTTSGIELDGFYVYPSYKSGYYICPFNKKHVFLVLKNYIY